MYGAYYAEMKKIKEKKKKITCDRIQNYVKKMFSSINPFLQQISSFFHHLEP